MEEYDLTDSWDELGYMSGEIWKTKVDNEVEKKNKERMKNICISSKGAKTKTRHVLSQLELDTYVRKPESGLVKMSRLKAKAIIMGRYGMLDCRANYKFKYKSDLCQKCGVTDDETHRINFCVDWKQFNLYNFRTKINFNSVYLSDPEVLNTIADIILQLWDITNEKNQMRNDS